ncbi:MAG: SAM-dependent methyltransferase [Acidobacteriota bacterium]|nr:SAM-dependent methyltransferase [Acidobacteriota bacterium]
MPSPLRATTTPGSLVVVGVGIAGIPHTTIESEAYIRRADSVHYLVLDAITDVWLRSLNAAARSLRDLYGTDTPRRLTYRRMAARIVADVRAGRHVCAVFYGHPGVFVMPAATAVRAVRKAGLPARMVPGISADACLYADLGVDPGLNGVQSFEATDFLLYRRRVDPTSALLLWQIGVLGEIKSRDPDEPFDAKRMQVLIQRLRRDYPARHRVTVYVAAAFPGRPPSVTRVALAHLGRAAIPPIATLYVPPLPRRAPDPRILAWLKESPGRTGTVAGDPSNAPSRDRSPGSQQPDSGSRANRGHRTPSGNISRR